MAAADGYLFLDNNRDWVVRGETATSWLQGDTAAVLEQQESSRRYYQRPDATYVELDPNRTSLGGWRGLAGAERQSGKWRAGVNVAAISPGFESNDLGFQPRADTISANASFSLGHFDTDRVTREREVGFNKSYGWNFGGEQQVDGWEVSGSATFLNYWEVQGSVGGSRRTLDDHLTRGGPLAAAPATLGGNFEFESDDRKAVTLSGEWEYRRDDADGWENELGFELKVKFGERFELSTEPTVARGRDVAQHIDAFEDPFATDTFGARYVFGEIDQTEVSMTTRLNVTFSPKLTLQLYVEPFIASGSYSRFKEFARPRTFDFFEYGVDRGTIAYDESEREYEVDPDGAGPAKPFRFDNEDFNEKSLIAKAGFVGSGDWVRRCMWCGPSSVSTKPISESSISGAMRTRSLLRTQQHLLIKMSCTGSAGKWQDPSAIHDLNQLRQPRFMRVLSRETPPDSVDERQVVSRALQHIQNVPGGIVFENQPGRLLSIYSSGVSRGITRIGIGTGRERLEHVRRHDAQMLVQRTNEKGAETPLAHPRPYVGHWHCRDELHTESGQIGGVGEAGGLAQGPADALSHLIPAVTDNADAPATLGGSARSRPAHASSAASGTSCCPHSTSRSPWDRRREAAHGLPRTRQTRSYRRAVVVESGLSGRFCRTARRRRPFSACSTFWSGWLSRRRQR